jgi:hypothetical protein
MSDISETISEKRRRGLPPRYGPETLAFVAAWSPDVQTVRGWQNKVHEFRALNIIREEPGLDWLRDQAAMRRGMLHAYRPTLLQELGRIEDAERLKAVARQLCECKPKTRAAMAMIRQYRLGRAAPAKAMALLLELTQTLENYRVRHPDLTGLQILEALALLADVVRRVDEEPSAP